MGLNLNHMSASANFKAGSGGAGKSHAMGISGSAYFQPDGKASGDAAKAIVGFPGHPDAAYIFSGSATSDGSGQDKLVVLGDMVISGTINGGGLVNSTGTPLDNQVAIWVDDDTLEGDASFTFDDSTLQVGASTADAKDLKVFGGSSGKQLLWDASASLLEITGTNGADALYVSDGNVKISDTLDVNGTADFDVSDFDVVSTGGFSIDGSTSANVTVAGTNESLTLAAGGGGSSQKLVVTSAGTGADAIDINATAGGIDIDAAGAISIDSSAGSIDMNVVDGQTISIGLNGATEMVFTPHGTPASEKISLTNTAGTADDAISVIATAGGVKVQAGDDSLHLDADGTDADALNIDSAGGMDVDVAGVLDMAAGDDSVIAVTTAAKDLALTVSGGGAQVLQLNSAGTGTDAIDINATAGGMDADVSAAINIATTGVAGDIALVSAHTAGVAFHIDANADAASEVQIDAGILDVDVTGAATIDAGGSFSVDAVGSSNFTTNGGLVLSGSTGVDVLADSGVIAVTAAKGNIDVDATVGSVSIDGAGGINIGTAADVAVDFDAAAFDLDASGAVSIDTSGAASDISLTSGHTAGDAIVISANADAGSILNVDAGIMDVDVQGTYSLDATGVSIDSDAASNVSTSAGALTLTSAAAATWSTAAGALVIDGAAGLTLDSDGTDAVNLGTEGVAKTITIGADASTKVDINALAIELDAAASVVVDAVTTMDLDSAGIMSLNSSAAAINIGNDDVDAAINIGTAGEREVTVGNTDGAAGLTLVAGTGGIDVDSDNAITLDTTAGGISLDAAGGAVNVTAAAAALTLAGTSLDVDASAGAVAIDASAGIAIGGTAGTSLDLSKSGVMTTVKGTLNVDEAATFDANVTISGNLDINGTTTTIDTKNMSVEDSIIALGVSGSDGSFSNVGDRGIIFARAAAATDALPALKWNGTGFEMGKYLAGPLSQSFGTANSLSGLKLGSISLPDSNASHFVSIGATSDDLTSDKILGIRIHDSIAGNAAALFISGNLTIEAASAINQDVTTDAQVQFSRVAIDGGSNYFDIDGSSNLTATAAGQFIVDSAGDITLDADGGNIVFKDAGTSILNVGNVSSDVVLKPLTTDKDIIFAEDGGTEIARFDSSAEALLMGSSKKLMLGAAEEYVYGDGTDIHFGVGSAGDINVPADIGLTFGDDGEKIEGDGTSLTISSSDELLLSAGSDVVIPVDVGLHFGDGAEKIESDNTDLTINSGGALNLTATTDVVIPAGVGVTFGSGEKIEGDSTDLTVTSGGAINLTATTDVVIPSGVGVTFGSGEKIEGDNTDLTVTSGGDIKLVATSDVEIPAGVGLHFDGYIGAEKIESDGTSLTITSGDQIILSATGNEVVPNADNDVDLGSEGGLKGGTSASSVTISATSPSFTMGSYSEELLHLDGSSMSASFDSGISNATAAFSSLSAGSLSTSTSFISVASESDMTLAKGALIAFRNSAQNAQMIYIVTAAFDGSGFSSSVAVEYYQGGSTFNGSYQSASLSDLSSGIAHAVTVSGYSGAGITDETYLRGNASGVLYVFKVKETVSSGAIAIFVAPQHALSSDSVGSSTSYSGATSFSSITKNMTLAAAAFWKTLYVNDVDLNGAGRIYLDADADTSILSSADDVIDFHLGDSTDERFQMTTSAFLPGADNSYDLGSSALRYRNIFTGDLNLQNDRGDWTLIEENDFISFRNNQSGKRYRMIMEDITGMGNYGPGNDGEM